VEFHSPSGKQFYSTVAGFGGGKLSGTTSVTVTFPSRVNKGYTRRGSI
jgi:hypothetical protein